MGSVTVTVQGGGQTVTAGSGQGKVVTLSAGTVAEIANNRPVVAKECRPTTVSTTSTPTNVTAGGGMGVQGPAGADGDKHYAHVQAVPAATWTVPHALNKRPSVTVIDSAGSVVIGEIEYDSADQLTLYFTSAFAGTAYCN